MKKVLKKHLWVQALKKMKNSRFRDISRDITLLQYLPNPKSKFPVKFIFT